MSLWWLCWLCCCPRSSGGACCGCPVGGVGVVSGMGVAGAGVWGLVVSGFPAHALSAGSGFCPVVGGGVLGLLVENCIVDASILKRSNF